MSDLSLNGLKLYTDGKINFVETNGFGTIVINGATQINLNGKTIFEGTTVNGYMITYKDKNDLSTYRFPDSEILLNEYSNNSFKIVTIVTVGLVVGWGMLNYFRNFT
jgi:hypothetical protein